MQLVVKKFGGSSVASIKKIKHVANILAKDKLEDENLVVVVSAMGDTTDELLSLAKTISTNPDKLSLDTLLASGEQISSSLLAIALNELGYKSIPLLSFQIPIFTDQKYQDAKIDNIDIKKINYYLNQGYIPIIAGFQGISYDKKITTLGRGGSDTSAVAIAAVLHAKECVIYTDVKGIYSSDPNQITNVKLLSHISYDMMMEMASAGAKVMHNRAVVFAKNFNIPLRICSTKENNIGTRVIKEDNVMEEIQFSAITKKEDETLVEFNHIHSNILTTKILKAISKTGVCIDLLSRSSIHQKPSLHFTIPTKNLYEFQSFFEEYQNDIDEIYYDSDIAIISIIGNGLGMYSDHVLSAFDLFERENIDIKLVNSSELRLSIAVAKDKSDLCVQILHTYFIEK